MGQATSTGNTGHLRIRSPLHRMARDVLFVVVFCSQFCMFFFSCFSTPLLVISLQIKDKADRTAMDV